MHLTRTRTRLAVAVCAAGLLVAACGGDDDSADTVDEPSEETTASTAAPEGDTSTSEAEPTTASTEAAPAGRPEDEAEAIIEAINLSIDDFAEGWVADEDAGDDQEGDELDSCFEIDVESVTVADDETPQFSVETPDGRGQLVNMQTVVFDSAETAEAVVAETATNQFTGCAADLFLASLNQGGGEVTVDLSPAADEPPLTEESVGIVGAISGTLADGSTVDGLVDLHVFRTADVVSFTLVVDLGDVAFEDTLTGIYQEIATRHAANVT
jgi:hypothetical protein